MRNLILKAYTWNQARKGEEGQTVIEYALIVAVVSIVLAALIAGMGTGLIGRVETAVEAAF